MTPQKIRKRTRNIFTLLVFATICYTIFNILPPLLKGNIDGVVSYFSKYIDCTAFVKLLVLNVPIISTSAHLWYLFATIYVYVIFYFVTALRLNEKVIYIISCLLLVLHILLGECLSGFGIVLPIPIVRNFALMGLPFFGLGLLVKKHENKLRVIPNYVIIVSAVIGIGASLLSRYFFGPNELYIGSLFVLFALVCVFIKYSDVQYPSFLTALEGCSRYIYVFHIMVAVVLAKIYALFGVNTSSSIIAKTIHPILVCVSSTIFAYFLTQILKKLHRK